MRLRLRRRRTWEGGTYLKRWTRLRATPLPSAYDGNDAIAQLAPARHGKRLVAGFAGVGCRHGLATVAAVLVATVCVWPGRCHRFGRRWRRGAAQSAGHSRERMAGTGAGGAGLWPGWSSGACFSCQWPVTRVGRARSAGDGCHCGDAAAKRKRPAPADGHHVGPGRWQAGSTAASHPARLVSGAWRWRQRAGCERGFADGLGR